MDIVKHQPYHNLYLPPEIVGMIIDCFIPRSGLQISNDPNLHAWLNTISALSRTSRMVRSHILHRAYNRPLNITITNARECRSWPGCSMELDPRLAKALALPLQKFPEIKITFAPELHVKPCRGSYRTIRHQKSPVVDKQLVKFRANMICMVCQSNALADKLLNDPTLLAGARFTFSWDGSRGVDKANSARRFPLWEFCHLEALMGQWRWVRERSGTTYKICFPEKVATRFISDDEWEELRQTPRYLRWILERFPAPSDSTELVEHTWPLYWGDFWAGPMAPTWFLERSDDPTSASRFIMTLTKIPGNAEGGYIYTAKRVVLK